MIKDQLLLLDAIHLAFNNPAYIPKNGVTHCNQYVNDVCIMYGFFDLAGKSANEIVDFLANSSDWKSINMADCQILANTGSLIVAGVKAEHHGHVVVICPGKEKISGRWGQVPGCASVGFENTIGKGINWCFASFPQFWVWRNSL